MRIEGGGDMPLITLGRNDAVIAVCGYERRATHLAEVFSPQKCRRLAIDFQSDENDQYKFNRVIFDKLGFEYLPSNSDSLVKKIREFAWAKPHNNDRRQVVVDLSSMSRYVIAATIEALMTDQPDAPATLFMIYNASAYTPRPTDIVDVLKSAPASPFFAGSLGDTSAPIAMVIGLGYEPARALGCLDQFEAPEVFAFRPVGGDERFVSDVDASNEDFLRQIGRDRVLDYGVTRPMELYHQLSSLVRGLSQTSRVVIVPFGPKIFSAGAMIVAATQRGAVAVWRVTGEGFEKPIDRAPTNEYAYYRIDLD